MGVVTLEKERGQASLKAVQVLANPTPLPKFAKLRSSMEFLRPTKARLNPLIIKMPPFGPVRRCVRGKLEATWRQPGGNFSAKQTKGLAILPRESIPPLQARPRPTLNRARLMLQESVDYSQNNQSLRLCAEEASYPK